MFWTDPLPVPTPIDPNGGAWSAMSWALLGMNRDGSFRAGQGLGPIVHRVSSTDPMVNIACTKWCNPGLPSQWRFPAGGLDGVDVIDGHLALIDTDQNLELDLLRCTWDGATLTGEAAAVIDVAGNGWVGAPCSGLYSARADGSALTAGLITPEDAAAETIDHALAMVLRTTRAHATNRPATHNDGQGGGWGTDIPEGARLFLPPTTAVKPTWPRPARQVATALKTYGAYVIDKGRFGVTCQGNGDFTGTGWENGGVHYPSDFPWMELRVMPLSLC